MMLNTNILMKTSMLWIVGLTRLIFGISSLEETQQNPEATTDYCLSETFEPRCLKNEVIHVRSAVYGRMRVGRCLSAEEVDAHRLAVGEDPRYFGCSKDVLRLFAGQCSGKKECRIRVFDISNENVKPCFPGLAVYLEVSYDCISIVDEKRSCTVTVSEIPSHIIGSSDLQNICGTKSQPWNVEAPIGQKVGIGILDFTFSNSGDRHLGQCDSSRNDHGTIIDKAGKRNSSICFDEAKKGEETFISTGNAVNILFNPSNQQKEQFLLRLRAVGCSDLIPPEDAWMRRNGETIAIGCYSSRQTWHLNCQEGKWIGVLGNCSHAIPLDSDEGQEQTSKLSDNGKIVGVSIIVGFTLILCLTIVCIGAIYLRKYYVNSKERQYSSVRSDCQINSVERLRSEDRMVCAVGGTGNDVRTLGGGSHSQMLVTYSV